MRILHGLDFFCHTADNSVTLISQLPRASLPAMFCLAFALLPAIPACRAQNSSAAEKNFPRVVGIVRDESGAAIPGARLRLEPEGTSPGEISAVAVTVLSEESGKYVIVAPSPGRYVLRATQDGFAELIVKGIELKRASSQQVDLLLHVRQGGGPIVEPPEEQKAALPPMQFSDNTKFAIAGMTDRSNLGLHGSDANVRTSDTLAKETAALRSASNGKEMAPYGAGDAHRMAGAAKEKSGDPVGAVNEYAVAVRLEPSEENYFAWGGELLLHRAGQPAVRVFAKGAEAHPKSARLLAGLGAAYYADGQFNEAAAQMCRAADLNPVDPQPYLFLGKMEQAAADPLPCSEEKLARFAGEQPRNAYANFYYGLILGKKARTTQDATGIASAETYLRKAVAIDPSLGEVYLQLGLLYNARGQKPAAITAFQKAVAAKPHLGAAHYQLSLAYRRAGNLAKAELEMKKYEKLRSAEDAQLEKERREVRQFVTILQDGKPPQP